jgi:hypothetical protein
MICTNCTNCDVWCGHNLSDIIVFPLCGDDSLSRGRRDGVTSIVQLHIIPDVVLFLLWDTLQANAQGFSSKRRRQEKAEDGRHSFLFCSMAFQKNVDATRAIVVQQL